MNEEYLHNISIKINNIEEEREIQQLLENNTSILWAAGEIPSGYNSAILSWSPQYYNITDGRIKSGSLKRGSEEIDLERLKQIIEPEAIEYTIKIIEDEF